ncbi:Ferrous iron transport protein B [Pyrodictium delaneyi]|uniref:Ferrous iron transport protein B n=1 Tax=Pyrodictium delaneyi TaxID=1273541 RepID=A0A0P0N5D5_9CREN|nr:ferrous iron transport protein B [Pyrodictium delaneyi]ALL01927.1 Ferrous iron transport protein B [Pyrodictium delaneyi]
MARRPVLGQCSCSHNNNGGQRDSSEHSQQKCDIVAALVGAPNSGKTTLFNALTGSSEFVANWPGATVDVKTAYMKTDGSTLCIVDLPGTYSISGSGPEEAVTRGFLLENRPDVIVAIADATILERSLFLPLELLEAFENVVVVLTKADALEEKGLRIDTKGLEKELGAPIILVSALEGQGLDKLIEALKRPKPVNSRKIIEKVLDDLKPYVERLAGLLADKGIEPDKARWLAVKLLEGYDWVPGYLEKLLGPAEARGIVEEAERLRNELVEKGVDPSLEFIRRRYEYASRLYERYVEREAEEASEGISRLDLLFLNPLTGPLVSLGFMLLVFLATYVIATGWPLDVLLERLGFERAAEAVAEYSLSGLVAMVMDTLAGWVEAAIPHPVLARLVGEGVLSSEYGLGLVLTFVPLLAVLMALIAALEDSGLLPRIAAGVDRFFRRFGVSGKAVFPAMVSLGCNVPGVISTRVMDSEQEKKAVAFAIPLIPCSARLAVLLALAHVFFRSPLESALAVFAVYLLSIASFLATLKLATHVEGSEASDIVLELPPLKRPSLRVVWWFVWDKLRHFLVRAGTLIVVASIALWLLANYGPGGYLGDVDGGAAQSYAASVGRLLAPYVELVLGVDYDRAWRIGFGLLGGFIAKEVFLDSIAVVSPIDSAAERAKYATLAAYALEPWQALALMAAVTLYIPCMATLATIYSETRSPRLALSALVYDFALATIVALAIRGLAVVL